MSQIFHRSTNTIARASIYGAVFVLTGLLFLVAQIHRSPWNTDAGVCPDPIVCVADDRTCPAGRCTMGSEER